MKKKMKKVILKAIVLVSLVGLLQACSSDDDSEMWERQSRNEIPVLRSSSEGDNANVIVSSGSTSITDEIGGYNVKISANWALYDASENSSVKPKGYVSITGSLSDVSCLCMTKNLTSSWSGTTVTATATIVVIGRNGSEEGSKTVTLRASGGTGTLS